MLHIQIPLANSFMSFLHCRSFKKNLAETKQQTSRNWIHSFYSREYFSWYVYFLKLPFCAVLPTKKKSCCTFSFYYLGYSSLNTHWSSGACCHIWGCYNGNILFNWTFDLKHYNLAYCVISSSGLTRHTFLQNIDLCILK